MDAILGEVKPHLSKMRAARDVLQKSVDSAKVGHSSKSSSLS